MKTPLITLTALALSLTVAATPNRALAVDACGVETTQWMRDNAAALDGFWTVTNGPGTLQMQGRTITLPPNPDKTVAGVTMTATGLEIGDVPGVGPVDLTFWSGGAIDFDGATDGVRPEEALSNAEIDVLLGCDHNELPRLHATGTFTEAEGEVEFDLYLMVSSTTLMTGYVIGRLNGGQGIARRILVMGK